MTTHTLDKPSANPNRNPTPTGASDIHGQLCKYN